MHKYCEPDPFSPSSMEASITENLWEISDIVMHIPEEAPKKHEPYINKTKK